MRVTVCQWPDTTDGIERAWKELVSHTRAQRSELILLPDMPFFPWLAAAREFNAASWSAAVQAHQHWESRLPEAGSVAVLGTRPYTFGNERISAGFIWEAATGCRAVHTNTCTRNEDGAWEQVWYAAAPREFTPAQVGAVQLGFLIGGELDDLAEARRYGEAGVQLLVTPRATAASTRAQWQSSGVRAALEAGAFGLSSNRGDEGGRFGGEGWIIDPNGELLVRTTAAEPFATRELDLARVCHQRRQERRDLPRMSSTSAA